MAVFRKLGCLAALVLAVVMVAGITALLAPWAFHIDGQWAPGYWTGVGELRSPNGASYPLYIFFHPNFQSMSHLRLKGVRATSGLSGTGWLCLAPGKREYITLSGDIYGAYLDADSKQILLRVLDGRSVKQIALNTGYNRRYFDLQGGFHGPQLAMQDTGLWEMNYKTGSQDSKARASVTFTAGTAADFDKLCAAAAIPANAQIAPPRN